VLIVIGLLTFLSELGLKVGPILASAGVVGIAVGFGAQTLVKDFLTGLFLIAEDVVSVGDNVRIGDSAGVVETMTMRTIRLRDPNGTLHIFPYSEAQVIHNRTKVFSAYLVQIPVSYDKDIDQALEILRAAGESMQKRPDLRETDHPAVRGAGRRPPDRKRGPSEGPLHDRAARAVEGRPRVQPRLKNAFDAARHRHPGEDRHRFAAAAA
jgi:small-conductance mechanosensitive channel